MAGDIALVALGIDTKDLERAGKIADTVLKSIADDMQKAENSAKKMGDGLKDPFPGLDAKARSASKSISDVGQSFTQLGGPIGQVAGQVSGLGSQFEGLAASFGLAGTAAIAGAAAIASLGAGMVKLTIEGAKLADQMGDIAEGTGLTIDQVQKLGAAFSLAGEDLGGVERAFRTFQGQVQEAISDPTSKAAQSFKTLGINAKEAGQNTGDAFTDAIRNLKAYRETTEGAVATNELFGRGIGSLVRSSEDLNNILGLSTQQLEDFGLIAGRDALDKANDLDRSINRLSHSFDTFKIILNSIDGGAITGIFADMASGLEKVNGWLNRVAPLLRLVMRAPAISPMFGGQFGADFTAPAVPYSIPGARSEGPFGRDIPPGWNAGGGGGGARSVGRAVAEEVQRAFVRLPHMISAREIVEGLKKSTDAFNTAMEEEAAARAEQTKAIEDFNRNLGKGVPLAIGGAPPIAAGGIPGAPRPFTEEEAFAPIAQVERVKGEFKGIFEDFIFQTITARKTLAQAFGGFALGIVDIFAKEFIKSLEKDFIDPIVNSFSKMLVDAMNEIFGGISSKGIGSFFNSMFKGMGRFFGGFFAEGGTLAPGKWGIVGERQAEVVYSGSTPMSIMPMSAAGPIGGNVTINFAVSPDASGGISRRTSDQIMDGVTRALQRSQKLRGSR